MEEDVSDLNSKIDHMMRVVCETFIVVKSLEKLDSKLDHCLTSLNRLSARVDRLSAQNQVISTPSSSEPPPSQPPKSKPLPRGPLLPNLQDQLISELKGKLKGKKVD